MDLVYLFIACLVKLLGNHHRFFYEVRGADRGINVELAEFFETPQSICFKIKINIGFKVRVSHTIVDRVAPLLAAHTSDVLFQNFFFFVFTIEIVAKVFIV